MSELDDETPVRMQRARAGAAEAGLDALLVSPGMDLRYLTGYQALPLERLTCLVLRSEADPVLVVPALERPAAEASPAGAAGLQILGWEETDDPYALVAGLVPEAAAVALDNQMWAEKVLRLHAALPDADQRLAGEVLAPLRMRKSSAEIEALRQAGAAIDRVHARVPDLLRARTHRTSGGCRHRRGHPRRRALERRLRDRRVRAQWRQPAPRSVRPSDPTGGPGGR